MLVHEDLRDSAGIRELRTALVAWGLGDGERRCWSYAQLLADAERADADEIERNPRSAAVRLRAVERVQGKGRP